MHKYAMIGYYPREISGQVYAVGNEGVTINEAKALANDEGGDNNQRIANSLRMSQCSGARSALEAPHLLARRRSLTRQVFRECDRMEGATGRAY